MTFVLLVLLKPALLCVEGGKWWLAPIAIIAWIADIIVAHTTWALVAGMPQKGEWTVSHTLERLCKETTHPDYLLFFSIARMVNRISPTRNHIKAIV